MCLHRSEHKISKIFGIINKLNIVNLPLHHWLSKHFFRRFGGVVHQKPYRIQLVIDFFFKSIGVQKR